jgi:hypothetical protein
MEEMGLVILAVALADKRLHRRAFVLDTVIIVSDGKIDNVRSRQSQHERGSSHEGSNNGLLEEHGGK